MTAASSPASPCRVSVVADGPLLRGAVTAALNQAGLVAEATNLDSDRDRAALAEFGPAVVMVHAGQGASLTLGEMTEVVSTVAPRARILVLTESEEEGPLLDAFARGADGFIPMTTSLDDLARTLQTLAHGRSVVDRERLSRLVHPQRRPVDPRHSHDGTVLTRREDEVLHLLVDGSSTDEISASLSISPATVRSHVRGVLAKLGAHSRREAVASVLNVSGG